MASKVAASALRRIVSNVEVERKFNPGPKFTTLLASYVRKIPQSNHHQPPSRREKPPFYTVGHPGQLIRDTYYDTEDGHLSKLGLWVRRRYMDTLPLNPTDPAPVIANGKDKAQWNAKLRLAGHYNNSQFVEVDGRAKVSQEVLRITQAKMKLEDLQVVSDLLTRRSVWEVTELADSAAPSAIMTIVLDAVTEPEPESNVGAFSHVIGEVEFFQEIVTEDKDDTEHEAYRKETAAKRMKELEEFMLSHPDLFSTNPAPIGKLSAYDMWKAGRT